MPSRFTKDPSETLDYVFDFAALTNGVEGATEDYLQSGETISSNTVVASDGLTVGVVNSILDDTALQVWVSGGTVGTYYRVTATIVTTEGRTAERSIVIKIVNR